MLQSLQKSIEKLLQFSSRQSALLLILTIFLAVAAVPGLFRIKAIFDLDELSEPSLPALQRNSMLKENYPFGPNLLYVFSKTTPFSGAELCTFKNWVQKVVVESPQLINVQAPFVLKEVGNCDPDTQVAAMKEFQQGDWKSVLSDASMQSLAINFEFAQNSSSPMNQEKISSEAKQLAVDMSAKLNQSGSSFFVAQFTRINSQIPFLSACVLLVIFIFLFLFLRTWKAPILFSLSLTLCLFFLHSLMGYFQAPIDMLSCGIGMIAAGLMLRDFLFLCAHYLQSKNWQRSFTEQAFPSFIVLILVAGSFALLTLSDFQVVQRFGLWTAVAAVLSWLTLFILLPAVLKKVPGLGNFPKENQFKYQSSLLRLSELRVPKGLSMLLLLVFISIPLLILGIGKFRLQDNPPEVFSKSDAFREGLQTLESNFAWIGELSLEIKKDIPEMQKAAILKQVGSHSLVTHIESFKESVDATNTQSTLSRESERFFSKDGNFQRYILYINSMETGELETLSGTVKSACAQGECQLAGVLDAYREFASSIPFSLLKNFFWRILLALGFLFLVHRMVAARNFWAWAVSSMWGVGALLLVFSSKDIPINYVMCQFFALYVSLVGANAIQFLLTPATARPHVDSAAWLSGIIIASTSLVFVGSYLQPAKFFGVLLAVSVLLLMFGDVNLLKSLLPKGKAK